MKRTSTDNQKPGDKPPMFSNWVTYGNLVFIAGKGEHGGGDITVGRIATIGGRYEVQLTELPLDGEPRKLAFVADSPVPRWPPELSPQATTLPLLWSARL